MNNAGRAREAILALFNLPDTDGVSVHVAVLLDKTAADAYDHVVPPTGGTTNERTHVPDGHTNGTVAPFKVRTLDGRRAYLTCHRPLSAEEVASHYENLASAARSSVPA